MRSPEDVLRLVASSDTRAFSGTVQQHSDLGLPSLPSGLSGSGSTGEAALLEFLTADHTAKVYVDGPTKVRVQLLDRLSERDVIRNGSDLWLYQSTGKQVTHLTIPAEAPELPKADATGMTPQALAQQILSAVDSSTAVTLGADSKVAGRDAYSLVLTPRTDATLVGSVSIAVDGTTGIPLRVQVVARGASTPALEVGFTSFSDQAPDAGVFAFTPPKGATIEEQEHSSEELPPSVEEQPLSDGQNPAQPHPTVTGEGWATIVSLPVGTLGGPVADDPLFSQLTRPVTGGHAFTTSLVSAFVTTDGRVLVGAVPVSALQTAAQ